MSGEHAGGHGGGANLAASIRTIADYPRAGILFRDITTLLSEPDAFRRAVDGLAQPFLGAGVSKVAGIEARGFILGGAVAHQLSAGFTPIRKRGKLPAQTLRQTYALEYGEDEVEIHADAVASGEPVLIIDDLIATGGTAEAAVTLLRRAGARIVGAAFVIDLPDLGGMARLQALGVAAFALVQF